MCNPGRLTRLRSPASPFPKEWNLWNQISKCFQAETADTDFAFAVDELQAPRRRRRVFESLNKATKS
jgi:hypothetical protein